MLQLEFELFVVGTKVRLSDCEIVVVCFRSDNYD